MSALGVLLRKELHATCTSPIAYAVGTVFLLVTGYTFSLTLFLSKVANLTYIFHQMYVLLVLLVPVLTMRAFAEERRADTLELLLTAPVREVWVPGAGASGLPADRAWHAHLKSHGKSGRRGDHSPRHLPHAVVC